MSDKVIFAIVGLGRFGEKRLKSILKNSKAEIAYIVDTNKEKLKKISKENGIEICKFETLINKNDVDVIIIATPNNLHAPLTIKALKKGKNVWCEKPMAINCEEAKKMLETSIETGNFLKVGSNVRFFPNILRLNKINKEMKFGECLFFRGWIGNSGEHLLNEESWFRKKEMIGGGTLLDNGVHLIDLARFYLGEIIKCEYFLLINKYWKLKGLEDYAFCIYKNKDNIPIIIQSSWFDWAGYLYFEIYFKNGFVHVDCRFNKAKLTWSLKNTKIYEEDYSNITLTSHDYELIYFIQAFKKGEHPIPTAYDGFRTIKLIFSVYNKKRRLIFDKEDKKIKEKFYNKFKIFNLNS